LPRELTSSEKALISSGNDFSYNIFHHVVTADSTKNVFISPLSISMALGMTLNGAAGETKGGIEKTLVMSGMKLHAINKSYESLIELLVNLDPKVKINIANSLWSRKGFSIKQSFKDSLQTYFNARASELDFDDPNAKNTINHWVKNQTNGRIKKIISSRIPSHLMLYLINATYFKGNWLYKFDSDDTKPAPFHLEEGSTVQVDMMHRKSPLATYVSDDVKMAQLAYGDSLYQMTILMPGNSKTSIHQFIKQELTASNVKHWTNQLTSGKEEIALPKFKSSYKQKLNDILKDMGMKIAFVPRQADFSKINSRKGKRMYISKVKHKANITVNEKGSEAAAVTSVGISVITAGPGPRIFRVNRPFVYMIRERISGTILFMGVMRNPAE
jgi:serpin B